MNNLRLKGEVLHKLLELFVVAVGGFNFIPGFAGLWWTRRHDGSWWKHCRLPWVWFLPWALVWLCSCSSNWQFYTPWSPYQQVMISPYSCLFTFCCLCNSSFLIGHARIKCSLYLCRGYMGSKLTNNIECEIFQVLLEEAKSSYAEEIVVALRSDSVEDISRNVTTLTDWVNNWRPVSRSSWCPYVSRE